MAHTTTHPAPITLAGTAKAIGAGVYSVLGGIGNFFVRIAETNTRLAKVERLQALSDAQLEKRGLKREDIVRHVFSDMFYL